MSDDANTLFDHQSQLETKRRNWDTWWQQLTERVLPSQAQITVTTEEGQKRTERLFDSRAVFANERFAAVMNDLLTPRTQRYHLLLPETEDSDNDQESKVHLERINNALFTERYRPRANFASQKIEGYLSLGAIGNSCMFVYEEVGAGPVYIGVHMREVFWSQGINGLVNMLYRKFPMGAAQAVKFFARMGATLPTAITHAAEKTPFQEFDFLHCVRPNDDRVAGRRDYRGMPYASYYAAYEGKQMLSVGGYQEWPYAIGRYHLGTRETYARSPAMAGWPAICTINEEKKTILRMGQREVEPPILLTEEGLLEAFNLKNGALNYGGLNSDGTEMAKPFKTGGNIPLGLELMELEAKDIDEAFLATIFKALVDNPQMTATQVLEVVQQKATLLAPAGARHESEDIGPMIQREIGILSRMSKYAWIADEMPEALRAENGSFKIEYRSPLARAMRAADGIAISRTLEGLTTTAQLDPDVLAVFDIKGMSRELAEINGTPAKFIRDEKVVQKLIADKQAQQQATQAAAAAPDISQSVLNISKAQQLQQGAA